MLKLIKNEIKTVVNSTIYNFTEEDLKELNKLITDAIAREKLEIDFCPLTMEIIERIWANQNSQKWDSELPDWLVKAYKYSNRDYFFSIYYEILRWMNCQLYPRVKQKTSENTVYEYIDGDL